MRHFITIILMGLFATSPFAGWAEGTVSQNQEKATQNNAQLVAFAREIGAFKANLKICNLSTNEFKARLDNAEYILNARYRQLGKTSNEAQKEKNVSFQESIKIQPHNVSKTWCDEEKLESAFDRLTTEQSVIYLKNDMAHVKKKRHYKPSQPSVDGTMNQDEDIFLLNNWIGSLKASLQICKFDPHTYETLFQSARYVSRVRKEQVGKEGSDEADLENRGFIETIGNFQGRSSDSMCGVIYRQAGSLYFSIVEQVITYIKGYR